MGLATSTVVALLAAPGIRTDAAGLEDNVGVAEASASSTCNGEDLSLWLYESSRWAPSGYHVLCLDRANFTGTVDAGRSEEDGQDAAGAASRIRLWRGGHAEADPEVWFVPEDTSLSGLRAEIETRARMRRQSRWRILPWALHTSSGAQVMQRSDLEGVLLAFEGGRWVWPGIREGFERRVALDGVGSVILRTLTLDPLAFTVDGFLSGTSAQSIIGAAKPKLKPAEIAATDAGVEAVGSQARTCSEAWVSPQEGPELDVVASRTAELTRVPRRLQVDFRVLKYKKGEHFIAHTDYYEKKDFLKQPHMLEELKHGRNWLVTLYVYLSDVKAGGETYFPSTYGRPLPSEPGKCEGPSVTPRLGRALMFYSLHPDGKPNLSSMHGGCKVKRGVKYTVNIWTFNQALNETEESADREQAIGPSARAVAGGHIEL